MWVPFVSAMAIVGRLFQVQCIEAWRGSDVFQGTLPPEQLHNGIAVHFNRESLKTPLFLCGIERFIEMDPKGTMMIFTPNSSLIENNLSISHNGRILYYDFEDLPKLFRGLPIEHIYAKKLYAQDHPEWSNLRLTDLIRWAASYKYGGLVTDLDILYMRPFQDIGNKSLVVPEDTEWFVNGYFRFPKHSTIVWQIMEDIADNWEEERHLRAVAGPRPITRVLERHCKISYIEGIGWTRPMESVSVECANIHILPTELLFPIHWRDADLYYRELDALTTDCMEKLEKAPAIHWWRGTEEWSGLSRACIKEDALLALLAQGTCPGIYNKHWDSLICEPTRRFV